MSDNIGIETSWPTPDPGDECHNDNHASGCRCHVNGGIVKRDPVAEVNTGLPLPPYAPGGMVVGPDTPGPLEEALRAAEATPPAEGTVDWFCDKAKSLVGGDRRATYGDALENFTSTGKLWAGVLGVEEVTAEQVALCMILLKIDRLRQTPNHQDSWVDIIGYAALGGDIAMRPGRYL